MCLLARFGMLGNWNSLTVSEHQISRKGATMRANDDTPSKRLKVALFVLAGVSCAQPTIAGQPVGSTNRPMRDRQGMVLTVGRGDLRGKDDKIIQAGIEYLDRMGGGMLEIGAGVYEMCNAVYLRPNITLRGSVTSRVPEPGKPLCRTDSVSGS